MHQVRNRRIPRRARTAAAALAASLLLAGGLTNVSAAQEASVLGPPNPATEPPITVGLITEGGSEALGSQSDLTKQGAQIGVKYANEYLGGAAGHRIKLFVCGNQATPAGATDCANQMVERNVDAVVLPFTGQGGAQVPIITGAGIPYISTSGASAQELTTPGAFMLTGGFPVVLAAQAEHAKRKGFEEMGILVIDVPAATQGADAIGGMTAEAAGIGFEVISAAPGTPDLSPQLQSAVDGGADVLGVVGDVTFCTSFLQGYETLALTTPKYLIAPCVDTTTIEKYGDVLRGSFLATTVDANPRNKDSKIYAAIVRKYGSGRINPNPDVSTGISYGVTAIVNFVNGLQGFTGDLTPEAITAQFKASKDVPIFLSGGLTYTCDGTAVSILPNICSAQIKVGTLTAKGRTRGLESYDVTDLFTS